MHPVSLKLFFIFNLLCYSSLPNLPQDDTLTTVNLKWIVCSNQCLQCILICLLIINSRFFVLVCECTKELIPHLQNEPSKNIIFFQIIMII